MPSRVTSALTSFRSAARQANSRVREILRDVIAPADRANEAYRELEDTIKANSSGDETYKKVISKSNDVLSEVISVSQEILIEIKKLSGNISGEENQAGSGGIAGALLGGALGFGAGSLLTGNGEEDERALDTPSNPSNQGGFTPVGGVEGFDDLEIGDIDFAPGAITSPNQENAHPESSYATSETVQQTLSMFSQLQGLFGGRLTINDFLPRSSTSRIPPSSGGGSQHWYGRAIDISTAGMSNEDKLRLVESAVRVGFTGFGFGNTILHVDTGSPRFWGYRNGQATSERLSELSFGGVSVSSLGNWVTGGQRPNAVARTLESSPLAEVPNLEGEGSPEQEESPETTEVTPETPSTDAEVTPEAAPVDVEGIPETPPVTREAAPVDVEVTPETTEVTPETPSTDAEVTPETPPVTPEAAPVDVEVTPETTLVEETPTTPLTESPNPLETGEFLPFAGGVVTDISPTPPINLDTNPAPILPTTPVTPGTETTQIVASNIPSPTSESISFQGSPGWIIRANGEREMPEIIRFG